MAKNKKIQETQEEFGNILVPDKNGVITIDKIPDPEFDMKYYEYDEKAVKRTEALIRSSFEYRELISFMKNNLDVNHCSFYPEYGSINGLTIELHHSPFTLYDITEAVIRRMMKEYGYWESFRVVEEVNRLHYEFKVGLTPLNPTAHKLVHSGSLVVHPKIVLGFWKEFYGEYNNYLGEDAFNKYNAAIDLEKGIKDIKVPKILEYKPSKLDSPVKLIDVKLVDKLCINDKLKKLESM